MTQPLVIVVTGSTDGIGKSTAAGLLEAGAHVVIHGRNKPRVDAAVADLRSTFPNGVVDGISFDLGSMAAVRNGAAALLNRFPVIDVLINNAGIFANERTVTADKMETTFAVNYAAPVLLSDLLMARLKQSARPTVINVSSIAHSRGRIHLDDLTMATSFTGYAAYAQSKLGNVMHAIDLASAHPSVRVWSLHPGVIGTKLLREGFGPVRGASVATGSKTSIALALGQLDGPSGGYFSDGVETPCAANANDAATRAALAAKTAAMISA
jgi:NAD(P)-dependent dehydrogenase (short-subunit alcohol dehydrogenase family)